MGGLLDEAWFKLEPDQAKALIKLTILNVLDIADPAKQLPVAYILKAALQDQVKDAASLILTTPGFATSSCFQMLFHDATKLACSFAWFATA